MALAHVKEELKNLAGRFSRLIGHNRNVFMPFYADIVNTVLTERSMTNTATNSIETGNDAAAGSCATGNDSTGNDSTGNSPVGNVTTD